MSEQDTVLVRTSETLSEIAKALIAAQSEFPTITKSRTAKIKTKSGGEFSYNYADLSDVVETTREVLVNHGLAVTQPIVSMNGTTVLATRLIHTSGEWIESTYPLTRHDSPQEMGSAITYARRYALCSVLGIVAEEDDDGQGAQAARKKSAPKKATAGDQEKPSADAAATLSEGPSFSDDPPRDIAQQRRIYGLARERGIPDDVKVLLRLRTPKDSTTDLSYVEAANIIEFLENTSSEEVQALVAEAKADG
jgi:hypothetical protein